MTFMRSPFLSCGRTSSGFSLVETLIVLMIIAGVLGFAVPGFQNQIIAKEVDAASGRLFQDLQLARVDSIRRGCPSSSALLRMAHLASLEDSGATAGLDLRIAIGTNVEKTAKKSCFPDLQRLPSV